MKEKEIQTVQNVCIVLSLLNRHVREPQLQLIRLPCLISHSTNHHKCYHHLML